MDIFEQAIMQYIVTDHSTLVMPQYDLESGWASFDFLAINLKRKIVYMVEVSSAANLTPLQGKINEAFEPGRHAERLKRQLETESPGQFSSWPIRAAVFIRNDKMEKFRDLLTPIAKDSVDVFAIQDCLFHWEYWKRIVGENRGWDYSSRKA